MIIQVIIQMIIQMITQTTIQTIIQTSIQAIIQMIIQVVVQMITWMIIQMTIQVIIQIGIQLRVVVAYRVSESATVWTRSNRTLLVLLSTGCPPRHKRVVAVVALCSSPLQSWPFVVVVVVSLAPFSLLPSLFQCSEHRVGSSRRIIKLATPIPKLEFSSTDPPQKGHGGH